MSSLQMMCSNTMEGENKTNKRDADLNDIEIEFGNEARADDVDELKVQG